MTCCVPILRARSRPLRIQRRIVSGSFPARFAASGTVIIARYYYKSPPARCCNPSRRGAIDIQPPKGDHPSIQPKQEGTDGRQGTGQQERRQEDEEGQEEGRCRRQVASPAGSAGSNPPLPARQHRPTQTDLRAAYGRAIPNVIAPGLRVLFCGINPGLYSGATGHHFARPGNRFWATLHRAGFTPRQLRPDETDELLRAGIGVTNLVNRATATAAELTPLELRAGGARLRETVRRFRPAAVAVVGISAYRTAFDRPRAVIGRQPEPFEGALLWVLPNPSGLNAHYQLDGLTAAYAALREAIDDA
jgi:double-stranded uracil-DNA glycosylase